MFVLFIGCVLQFDLSIGSGLNQMPPRLLEMSLQHVNTLLADIDDKIAVERELLSQIDDSAGRAGKANVEKLNRSDLSVFFQNEAMNLGDKSDKRVTVSVYERGPDGSLRPTHSPNGNGNQMGRQPSELQNFPPFIKAIVPEFPILEPEWSFEHPTAPPTTPPPITTTITIKANAPVPNAITNVLKNSPIRKSMVSFMKEENVKYISAFVKGLAESLTPKSDETLKVLLEAFGTVLLRMSNNNKLNCGGEVLVKRFKEVATSAKSVSPSTLRNMMSGFLSALQYRVITFADGLELLLTYDNFFNTQEGNNLLDIIVAIHNYDVKAHGKQIAETLCERCIEAFTAPGQRLCGTSQLEGYINRVNDIYTKRYKTMRSGDGNMISSLIETFLTSGIPIRRFLSTNFKHIPEYKKMIRHYMSKHPSIFKTFAKHFKHSEERKHRHSKHKKKHHNTHHRKHHHNNHKRKHHKEKKSKNINNNNDIKNKKILTTKRKQPRFRGLPDLSKTANIFTKMQKRYNIVDESSRKLENIAPIDFISRRRMRDNEYVAGKVKIIDERNDISYNLSKTFPTTSVSTRRFTNNNTILETIIGESSYSDDELYLKTMLKDAFFHGNHTLPADHSV